MCGIFGVLANYPVISQIIKGLTKLEYRGYDSSGVAILENKKINTIRAKGKLINLKKKNKFKENQRRNRDWSYKMGYSWYTI